jgi:hypothetical protein
VSEDFHCKRFWYQGPPLARGLYAYHLTYPFYPKFRFVFRWTGRGLLIGTKRNHIFWCVRYGK